MEKYIGPFKLYTKKPNAIKYGYLYTLSVKIDVPYEKKRTVRVYLPEDYDSNKKYPVMYMSDGQNIVDKYTTAYGEWNIDVRMHERIKAGKQSFIVVGIDCPKDPIHRGQEYVLNDLKMDTKLLDVDATLMQRRKAKSYGMRFSNWLVNTLKPIIDENFSTLKEKEWTAAGGSSMGGLFAFEIASYFPEVFSFALSFSPAFDLFNVEEMKEAIRNRNLVKNDQKYFFFCGGKDLDALLLPGTISIYNLMTELGYDNSHNGLLIDSRLGHSEKTWSKYYNEAIKFWLK